MANHRAAEHMDVSRFVQRFIRKERRERLLYELTRPEKQLEGLDRFCHQSRSLLDPRMIRMEGEGLERRAEFRRFVETHDELCFVLSPDFYLDELLLPLERAVALSSICCDAVLILGSDFAVVFGEAVKDGREKFLLTAEGAEP